MLAIPSGYASESDENNEYVISMMRRQWMTSVPSAKSKASSHCARTKFARTSDMSRVAKRSAVVR